MGDQHRLAVGGDDATIRVVDADRPGQTLAVDLAGAKPPHGFPPGPDEISGVAYVAKLDAIAVTTSRQFIYLIDAKSQRVMGSWYVPASQGPVCYVPSEPGLLVTGGARLLGIWNIESQTQSSLIATPENPCAIRYSPTAQCVAVFFHDATVRTWTLDSLLAGKVSARQLISGGNRGYCGDISPNGRAVAVGDDVGRIHVWNGQTIERGFSIELTKRPWRARFSPDGKWLAVVEAMVGDDHARVMLLDALSQQVMWSADAQAPPSTEYDNEFTRSPWPIEFDADGKEVIISAPDKSVCGRDVRSGEITRVYLPASPMDTRVIRIQCFPGGKELFIARISHVHFLVNCRTGEARQHKFDEDMSPYGKVHTVLGNLWLSSEVKTRDTFLTTANSTDRVVTLKNCPDRVETRVAVSRDGRQLAIGGESRIVYCWDLLSGGPPRKFIGHDGVISDLCFSPDGQTILSHAADGTVRFWQVATGAELLKLGTPEEPITCMGLNRAGNLLVLGVERDGQYGLQLHRMGKDRDSLPKRFSLLPPETP